MPDVRGVARAQALHCLLKHVLPLHLQGPPGDTEIQRTAMGLSFVVAITVGPMLGLNPAKPLSSMMPRAHHLLTHTQIVFLEYHFALGGFSPGCGRVHTPNRTDGWGCDTVTHVPHSPHTFPPSV